MLTREAILAANDTKVEEVKVPEWGGTVFVRSLSGKERDRIEASLVEFRGKTRTVKLEGLRGRMAAATICDETGKLLFTESDIQALGAKSAAALDRVVSVAQRLSAMTKEDVEVLVEDLKNDQPDALPTGSP